MIPSIALIVATTMLPEGLRHPSLRFVEYSYGLADFVNNLLLYIPFGFAAARLPFRRVLLYGFLLSTAAESLQLGFVHRVPSPCDIVTNTCGALTGYGIAALCRALFKTWPQAIPVPRLVALAAIPLSVIGCLILVRHRTVADFSNWNPTFELLLGNESTGDRPWEGTVSKLAIYPFALGASEIRDVAQIKGPHVDSRLAEVARVIGAPAFQLHSASRFTKLGQPLLISQEQAANLYEALVRRNRLTILTWIQSSNLRQAGPARIVTYSEDTLHRNFMLGQVGSRLTFRLRTPTSGANGSDPELVSGPVLVANRATFVAAVYDGNTSSLYVDGKSVAQADLKVTRPHLPYRIISNMPRGIPRRELEFSVSEAFLSGLFVLGMLYLTSVSSRPSLLVAISVFGGTFTGGVIWGLGVSDWHLGFRIFLECIAAGLAVYFSLEKTAEVVPPAMFYSSPVVH